MDATTHALAGLSHDEAARLLAAQGRNKLPGPSGLGGSAASGRPVVSPLLIAGMVMLPPFDSAAV